MSKILVTYFSRTGNTKKVAEAIFETIPGDKELRPMNEVGDPSPYRLIFAGFPVQAHSVPYQAEIFLKKIPGGQKVALFSTCGAVTGSELSRQALEYAAVLVSKAKLLGTFSCRGRVSLKALEALTQFFEHEAWVDMAASAATHPDDHDLSEARAFADRILTISAHGHYQGL